MGAGLVRSTISEFMAVVVELTMPDSGRLLCVGRFHALPRERIPEGGVLVVRIKIFRDIFDYGAWSGVLRF